MFLICPSRRLFEEDSPERSSEVLIEDGVYDRIEGRVHVAQPEGDGEGEVRNGAGGAADGVEDVQEEEGEPTGDERTHDEAEDERRSLLLFPRQPPLFSLWISNLRALQNILSHQV